MMITSTERRMFHPPIQAKVTNSHFTKARAYAILVALTWPREFGRINQFIVAQTINRLWLNN